MADKIEYFLAPTPFGPVYVCPLRDGEVYVKTDGGNYEYQRKAYEGTGEHLALTVNRVEYKLTTHMHRDETGVWVQQGDGYLTRRQGMQDPSAAAKARIDTELIPALAEWLVSEAAEPVMRAMAEAQQAEEQQKTAALRAELEKLDARRTEILAELGKRA